MVKSESSVRSYWHVNFSKKQITAFTVFHLLAGFIAISGFFYFKIARRKGKVLKVL